MSVSELCSENIENTNDILTDFLFHEYDTPMFTAKISCCQYPSVYNIPYIWRDILKPTMRLLNIVKTGKYKILLLRRVI